MHGYLGVQSSVHYLEVIEVFQIDERTILCGEIDKVDLYSCSALHLRGCSQ